MKTYFSSCVTTLAMAILAGGPHFSASAQTNAALEKKIKAIMARPEYRHARFGMEFYSLDKHRVIYAHNEQELFVPGSTTKLLSEGTALKLLGPDFRFKTKVYKTGPVDTSGTLKGDVVLVASGDPDLSGRMQPDGTLAFEDEDHSYSPAPGAKVVPGNPLAVIDELAAKIAAKGIRHIEGRVLVDVSLFPEGGHEGGSGVTISPICVNDNVIDVMAAPGVSADSAANLKFSPETKYTKFVNKTKTAGSDGKFDLDFTDHVEPDGNVTVTVTGTVPLGMAESLTVYKVKSPSKFAQTVLAEALAARGVTVVSPPESGAVDFAALKPLYTEQNEIAEHTSAVLTEEAKVTLKVSQNLHASMTMPYLVGVYAADPKGESKENPVAAGFKAEHAMLEAAGLDLSGAVQSDGAGAEALFTPDFMAHYLTYISQQSFAPAFQAALPVLGKDGTLVNIQKNAAAAGHVFAKTGTYAMPDYLNGDLLITGKGLAGYIVTAKGQRIAFATYANFAKASLDSAHKGLLEIGNLLGEIAAAAYDTADSE